MLFAFLWHAWGIVEVYEDKEGENEGLKISSTVILMLWVAVTTSKGLTILPLHNKLSFKFTDDEKKQGVLNRCPEACTNLSIA